MKKKLLFILILAFSLTNCDLLKVGDSDTDKEPELPPITTTGENTFGAIVNGEVRVVTNFTKLTAIHQVSDIVDIGGVFFDREKNIDQSIGISISDEDILEDTYEFNSNTINNRFFSFSDDNSDCLYSKKFNESTEFEGTLEIIKLDKSNKIISGVFSFSIRTEGCPNIIVENGRFDLKYIN
ncbi:MAG: hypothetical protein VYB44_17680 [Bacteroidota bacterium]|nr:hypothetical protein [Bacteroidota bacterium]